MSEISRMNRMPRKNVGADWPIHDLAEGYLYSMHMLQHMLFTLVAPPLLIAGIPAWMWRGLLRPRPLFVAFRFVTRPVVALIVFNGLLLFTHWPEIVKLSVTSELGRGSTFRIDLPVARGSD